MTRMTRPGQTTPDFFQFQLQKMRDEFQRSLHSSVAESQSVEKDPVEGDITAPHSNSPPRVLSLYQQHIAYYVHLFMEEGEELTLGEDPATPLIVEVFLSILGLLIYLLYYFHLISYTIPSPSLHFQALQKISLADHIRRMVDQLHANAIQQLEVALFRSPAAEAMDLLSASVSKCKPATVNTAQPHPLNYTATPPAPPSVSVPVVRVSEFSSVTVMVTVESKPDEEIPTTLKTTKQRFPIFLHQFPNVSELLLP